MADRIIFVSSAFRHGCTQTDIEWAIETKIYEGLLKGEDDIYAIIGFATSGNPIEIFYNLLDAETLKIFHAMPLRSKIADQLND